MTWVKICGTTNFEDALTAANAGADALGFVFYKDSPRNVEPAQVKEIIARLPERIEKVGVFVDASSDEMLSTAAKAGLTAVQIPGTEDTILAEQLAQGTHPRFNQLWPKHRPRLKVIVALSMRQAPEGAVAQARGWPGDSVFAFLMDSGSGTKPGGTGQVFDWENCAKAAGEIAEAGKVVAAGGLNSGNVSEAMRILRPWGVDVASGVEAKPGKKDPEKVRAFIGAVRKAGQTA